MDGGSKRLKEMMPVNGLKLISHLTTDASSTFSAHLRMESKDAALNIQTQTTEDALPSPDTQYQLLLDQLHSPHLVKALKPLQMMRVMVVMSQPTLVMILLLVLLQKLPKHWHPTSNRSRQTKKTPITMRVWTKDRRPPGTKNGKLLRPREVKTKMISRRK